MCPKNSEFLLQTQIRFYLNELNEELFLHNNVINYFSRLAIIYLFTIIEIRRKHFTNSKAKK